MSNGIKINLGGEITELCTLFLFVCFFFVVVCLISIITMTAECR